LQAQLAETALTPHVWLSGGQGPIDILPGTAGRAEQAAAAPSDLGICPYMGLRAFGEDDDRYFFGREALVQTLLAQLHHRPFLAAVGASGSGKSSLLRAGVLAQLRQGRQIPGSDGWRIGAFRPGAHPLAALAQHAVDPDSDGDPERERLTLEGLLYQGVEGWVRWLRTRPEPQVVLAVDQFEELFSLASSEDRQRFLELMLGAVRHAGDRFKLAIGLRADFVTACLEFRELADWLQEASTFVPPYLAERDYRRAIVEPAERVGLQIEPELVELLLQDLSPGAGNLPLLEFVLEQLWEHREAGKLTLQAYQQQIGGLQGALERKADAVYNSLDAEAQACAQWIFLALTQLGETSDTCRRVSKADLAVDKYPSPLVERTLQALAEANLVVVTLEGSSDRPGASARGAEGALGSEAADIEALASQATVEVAHEILIRHWSTLRWWLAENRTRLQLRRQLEQSAQIWQQHGYQPDYLWQGARLAEAEEVYINNTDELSQTVQQFIEAGLAQREAWQRREKRRLRRAQVAAAALGVLGFAAAVLGGATYWQQRQASIGNVATLNASTRAMLESQRPLEAIVAALKAGQQLQEIWHAPKPLQLETSAALQQALSGTQQVNRWVGHEGPVQAVVTSPGGDLAASASWDGTVRLWNADGSLARTLRGHEAEVMEVSFHPSRQLLATASLDGTLKVWRFDGTLQRSIATDQQGVASVAFSPDGRKLAAAGRDGTVQLWRAQGQRLRSWSAHSPGVDRVAFSPDGAAIATASKQATTVKLWRPDGTLMRSLQGHGDGVSDVAFGPQGTLVATASLDGRVRVWRTEGKLQATLDSPDADANLTSVAFGASRTTLVTGRHDGTIARWQWRDRERVEVGTARHGGVRDVRLAPNRRLLAAGGNGAVGQWQLERRLAHRDGGIYSVRFSPDGELVASSGWGGTIALWQRAGQAQLRRHGTLNGHQAPIPALAFSPDGRILASGSHDGTLKLWQLGTGSVLRTLAAREAGIASVSWDPNGRVLAAGRQDGTIRLWRRSGERLAVLSGHRDTVASVRFGPDGRQLVSGSYDGTARLWRRDGKLLHALEGHDKAVAAVAFGPQGDRVATASWDRTIKLWRAADGKLLRTLEGHEGGVTALAWLPNDRFLASASADSTVKLWDLDSAQVLATLRGHRQAARSIDVSPDGETLASAGKDGKLQSWQLQLDALMQQGCARIAGYLQTHPNASSRERALCQQAAAQNSGRL